MSFNDSFSFILATKLKALKAILKSWNRDVFGWVEVNKSKALPRVSFWDEQEKDRAVSQEEFKERNLAKEDFKY